MARNVALTYEKAIERVTEELKKEGFGVLTSIDIKETLKKKLDVDFKRYIILGACNPPFAYQALQADEEIGLLLPCNVVVREDGEGARISAFDPMAMVSLADEPAIAPIARQVKDRLERVLAAV